MAVFIPYIDRWPLTIKRIHTKNIDGVRYPITPSGINFRRASPGFTSDMKYENSKGVFKDSSNFPQLFPSHYNFSYWDKGQIDFIFNGFDKKKQLWPLNKLGKMPIDGTEVTWMAPQTAIVYDEKYLINIGDWVSKDFIPKDISDIQMVMDKLEALQKLGLSISPYSLSSTGASLLISTLPEEFFFIRAFGNNKDLAHLLIKWHQAYPAKLEWLAIGNVGRAVAKDQTKSHLSCFLEMPSLSLKNIYRTIEREGPGEVYADAHPGSLYIIEVTLPEWLPTGIIPYEKGWPTGYIPHSDPICKPFIDLLDDLKIPYKILWSYQILIRDTTSRPWTDLVNYVWGVEDYCKKDLYPIQLKNLHWMLAGHMMHLHYLLNQDTTFIEGIESSLDYNPPLACAIKSLSICKSIRKALKATGLLAVREDNYTARQAEEEPGWVTETGDMQVYNPLLFDKAGKTRVRDLIEQHRDLNYIPLSKKTYNALHGGLFLTKPLGTPSMDNRTVEPGAFLRTLDRSNRMMKNGYLLDHEIVTLPPKVHPEFGLNIHNKINFGELNEWLESWTQQVSQR